jgi:hypothetical protein
MARPAFRPALLKAFLVDDLPALAEPVGVRSLRETFFEFVHEVRGHFGTVAPGRSEFPAFHLAQQFGSGKKGQSLSEVGEVAFGLDDGMDGQGAHDTSEVGLSGFAGVGRQIVEDDRVVVILKGLIQNDAVFASGRIGDVLHTGGGIPAEMEPQKHDFFLFLPVRGEDRQGAESAFPVGIGMENGGHELLKLDMVWFLTHLG